MYFIYKDKSISQKVWRNKFIYISVYIASAGLKLSTGLSSHTHSLNVSLSFFFFLSLSKCRHPLLSWALGKTATVQMKPSGGVDSVVYIRLMTRNTHTRTRKKKKKKKRKKPCCPRLKFAYTVASTRRDYVVIPARCREITSGQQRNGRATHCVVLNHQGMTQSRRTRKEMKTSTVPSDSLSFFFF